MIRELIERIEILIKGTGEIKAKMQADKDKIEELEIEIDIKNDEMEDLKAEIVAKDELIDGMKVEKKRVFNLTVSEELSKEKEKIMEEWIKELYSEPCEIYQKIKE